jgi:hypothetical protein
LRGPSEDKKRVRGISLRKEGLLGRQLDDSSPQAGARQKGGGIEFRAFQVQPLKGLLPIAALQGTTNGGMRYHIATGDQSRCAMVKNHRVHTKTPGSRPNYTPVGEVQMFTFAHHFGKYFRYLGFRDVKMESDEARRESRRQSNQLESIIATDAHVQGEA